MYAVREGWRGRFDEDRASRERVVTYRAGKRGSERETTRREARREERRTRRTIRTREERDARRVGRRAREERRERDRVVAREGVSRMRVKKRGRRAGKRGGTRYREGTGKSERERERARGGGAGGRERESAHRPARRRERDGRICVLKQTFDQSADCCQSYVAAAYPSVPVAGPRIQFRVFTRRGNQGPSARRGYPRKPRD